ncbi:conserved hypothetical protein, partial [Perkinsus marinus ATCC 50983]
MYSTYPRSPIVLWALFPITYVILIATDQMRGSWYRYYAWLNYLISMTLIVCPWTALAIGRFLVGVIDWDSRLSLGEQQRLSMARLFWHRPTFAILDECTSAVSIKMERRLFKLCGQLGISLITISHRPALHEFHHHMVTLDGCG